MSNLLKDASILLTPTAYENGRMNAIKPYKDLYGPELVTNGDFATDSDWDKGNGTTISGGKANLDGSLSGSFQDPLRQFSVLTVGKKYKITFTISDYVSGAVVVFGDGSTEVSANGTYTQHITATITNLSFQNRATPITCSIDNVSVVEDLSGDFTFSRGSAATRVNAQGLVENVQIISPELVSNGNFSQIGTEEVSNGNFSQEGSELVTNGDFSNGLTNWIVNGGSYATIVDGALNSNNTENGSWFAENISQSVSFVQNKIYKVTFKAKNISGNLNLRITHQSHIIFSENITSSFVDYTIYYTAQANNDSLRIFCNDAVGQFQIDNVSVKEVGQDWDISIGDVNIGENIATFTTSTNSFLIQTNFIDLSVKTYRLQYEILETNGNSLRLAGGGSAFGTVPLNSSVGTHTFYIQSNGTQNNLQFNNQSSFIGSITNISVKEVGQDWTFVGDFETDGTKAFITSASQYSQLTNQIGVNYLLSGRKYRLSLDIPTLSISRAFAYRYTGGSVIPIASSDIQDGKFTTEFTMPSNGYFWLQTTGSYTGLNVEVDNISVKEITDDTDLPRINYEGFSYQDSLGSELVVNGDFATDTGWSKGAGWSIGNGVATHTGEASYLSQSILNANTQYKVNISVTSVSGGGFVQIYMGNSPASVLMSNVGEYEYIFTSQSSVSLGFALRSLGDVSIDNVSVKEYLGQEVVPDSGCGSWLLEPQSTNLVTYSEDFSQWSDEGIRMNIALNSHTAPNGEMSAASAIPPNGEVFGSINMPLAMVSGTTYTQSVYAKPNGQDFIRIRMGSLSAYFNVSEGTIGTTSAGLTTSITESNNGFYRCVITGQFDGSNNYMRIYSSATDGSISTGDGVNGVYIWGAQTEQQSYATSYIPTNGATNTRLQDIANNSGNSTLINSTEGVLVFKPKYLVDNGASRKISISDGSSSNRLYITPYQGLASRLRYIFTTGGVTQADLQITGLNLTSENIFAVVWDNNRFEFWCNGVKISEDTNGTTPSQGTFNILILGSELNNNTELYQGFLDFIAVYKEALTDANLRCLTYPNPVATTFDLDFDTIAEQFTFTRGSEATFVNAQGLIESTASNDAPRIDYSTGEKAFLLEPQSTNITPYSEDFTQSWTPTGLTITSNSIASPSGEINSDKWVEDTSNGAHNIRNNPNLSVTSGNNYTMSIFAKAGERTGLRFANAAESGVEGRFDLSNGTVTLAGTNTTFVGIEDYGNGWYRCIISFTASTTIAQLNLRLMDGSSLSYQGDGTSGLYAWGAQLEQQSYATSYIPTDGASATRNQELCNNATPVINSEEGTLYAEISALANGGDNRQISISDGTNNNVVILRTDFSSNSLTCFVRGDGGSYAIKTITGFSQTDNNKIAVVWNDTNLTIWVNGIKKGFISINDSPIGLSKLSFSSATVNSDFFYGNTKDLKIYPKALADVQLEDLTTI